jgi:DNA repair exonuclease SbcCD ATPase subunit
MIERIQMQNFQKYERRDIEFAPDITVLIGPTDSGKTSVIRFLYWLCLNNVPGEPFIKHGEKFTRGKLIIDGRSIVRKRGPGPENSYKLDGKEFNAFGRSTVPEEIEKLINVNDLNFSHQMDAPFWFSLSPAKVSQELNQIIDLDIIDNTLAVALSNLSSTKSKVKVSNQRLSEAHEKLTDLAWVEQAQKVLVAIETVEDSQLAAQNRLELLGAKIRECERLEKDLVEFPDAQEFVETYNQYAETAKKLDQLTESMALYEDLEEEICQAEKRLLELEAEKAKLGQNQLCKMCGQPILPTKL